MKNQLSPWPRLLKAARQAPADEGDTSAPLGFAARISALAFTAPKPNFATLFTRLAPRALSACGMVMILGITLNIGTVLRAIEPESTIINDPVAEWLDAAS
jgi:hypothetical protein